MSADDRPCPPCRERLPGTRKAITHKLSINGHEGYLCVGLYPDGRPGELFITMAKEGSTIGGLMDVIGILASMALQHGVPVADLVRKLKSHRFEPSGFTTNEAIPEADSVADYIGRWLEQQFCSPAEGG